MAEVYFPVDNDAPIKIDLKSPLVAAALAWLWPGAGHIYQGRYAKGALFMICILSTYFFGLGLGQGRVVYAAMRPGDYRWQYLMQVHVGIPALPAIIQSIKTSDNGPPFFVLCERYPENYGVTKTDQNGVNREPIELEKRRFRLQFQRITRENNFEDYKGPTLKDGLMAPPAGPMNEMTNDVLGQWHFELKRYFDIGTYYTVIAGILNLLVVYDAFVGPGFIPPSSGEKKPETMATPES